MVNSMTDARNTYFSQQKTRKLISSKTNGNTALLIFNRIFTNIFPEYCVTTGCGGISIPNGGLEFPEGTKYGDTAFIKCSNGYHLTGVNSTSCMSNGIWETPAACEKNGMKLFFKIYLNSLFRPYNVKNIHVV